MCVKTIPFSIDAIWVIRTLLQLHFDKNYNLNDEYCKAVRFSLSEILYMDELTEDEIQIIFKKYAENHGLGNEITLTGDSEQVAEVFGYLFDLDRYKDELWKNTVKGYGEHKYGVLDLIAKKEYPAYMGEHYLTLMQIIDSNYLDEFTKMTQEEKDQFILDNFDYVGNSGDKEDYLNSMQNLYYLYQ